MKSLKDIPYLLLLCRGQGCGKLDVIFDDEVSSLTRLFRDGHAEARVRVRATGLGWTTFVEVQLFAVDGVDGSLPAR